MWAESAAQEDRTLFDRARSAEKDIFVVQGASHYDLYDQPKFTGPALERLESFFAENLWPPSGRTRGWFRDIPHRLR